MMRVLEERPEKKRLILVYFYPFYIISCLAYRCLGGEIGRRKGLKIPRLNGRAGSTPARGTIKYQ